MIFIFFLFFFLNVESFSCYGNQPGSSEACSGVGNCTSQNKCECFGKDKHTGGWFGGQCKNLFLGKYTKDEIQNQVSLDYNLTIPAGTLFTSDNFVFNTTRYFKFKKLRYLCNSSKGRIDSLIGIYNTFTNELVEQISYVQNCTGDDYFKINHKKFSPGSYRVVFQSNETFFGYSTKKWGTETQLFQASNYSGSLPQRFIQEDYAIHSNNTNSFSRMYKIKQAIVECNGKAFDNPEVCSGNGICNINGKCICKQGYEGKKCQSFNCFNISSHKTRVCSGHGTCASPNNCLCPEGYEGDQCEIWKCNDKFHSDPTVCNKKGKCVAANHCKCKKKYHGSDCKNFDCFGVTKIEESVCSGNGVCYKPNKCMCFTNYTGKNCFIPIEKKKKNAIPSKEMIEIELPEETQIKLKGGDYVIDAEDPAKSYILFDEKNTSARFMETSSMSMGSKTSSRTKNIDFAFRIQFLYEEDDEDSDERRNIEVIESPVEVLLMETLEDDSIHSEVLKSLNFYDFSNFSTDVHIEFHLHNENNHFQINITQNINSTTYSAPFSISAIKMTNILENNEYFNYLIPLIIVLICAFVFFIALFFLCGCCTIIFGPKIKKFLRRRIYPNRPGYFTQLEKFKEFRTKSMRLKGALARSRFEKRMKKYHTPQKTISPRMLRKKFFMW